MAKGYSLHLGLNFVDPKHYGGWDGELAACEFDANDMAAIAKAVGYAETTVLLTKEATAGRLIQEMLRLAKTLEQGDLLLLTYSGHGGQIPPGFKGSSQRLPASIVAPRQRLRRVFSSQGSFAVWH
jgi:hypothetical protein